MSPVRVEPVREPFLVAGQAASILVADGPERGARVGVAGQLMPALADAGACRVRIACSSPN